MMAEQGDKVLTVGEVEIQLTKTSAMDKERRTQARGIIRAHDEALRSKLETAQREAKTYQGAVHSGDNEIERLETNLKSDDAHLETLRNAYKTKQRELESVTKELESVAVIALAEGVKMERGRYEKLVEGAKNVLADYRYTGLFEALIQLEETTGYSSESRHTAMTAQSVGGKMKWYATVEPLRAMMTTESSAMSQSTNRTMMSVRSRRNRGNVKKRRRLRNAVDAQGGRCYWCGCRMRTKRTNGGHIQANQATIDHIDTRYDSVRGTYNNTGAERTVAACSKCNFERGRDRELRVPIQERQQRSANGRRT